MREIKRGSILFIAVFFFTCLSLLVVVNQMFNLSLFGIVLVDNTYMYIVLALNLGFVFPLYPIRSSSPKNRVPWYDTGLFISSTVIASYFAIHGLDITRQGWEYNAPIVATIFSVLLWLLALEAVRRTTDMYMLLTCVVFSAYPLFAVHMPGFLQGQSYDFLTTARLYSMGTSGILGIPLYTVCTLLIGFMLFGIVLQATGGGSFFFNLAQALFGRARGGAAKISVLASAFFGMISGSTVSNTLTIGSMTIPAMKGTGFPSHYAAAIEACASTGGPIMPPVMGAAAFIMASFLNISYANVCIGAFFPAALYYLGLFVQVDGYSVKAGLKGLSKGELPSISKTLKGGWFYILSILLLIYLLLFLKLEERAPFYVSGAMVVLSMIKKETRLNFRRFTDMIVGTGKLIIQLVSILAAAGLIIGGFAITGVALSFAGELVRAVGNNVLLILAIGAVASFILGLGMTITACYVFLAIVMVPALVALGIDPLAAHLFVFYWGALSEITPPVAFCVTAASGIAGSDFMKTGVTAMKLGAVKYLLPFFFAYNPALLTHGPWWAILLTVLFATFGVIGIGSALEGYLLGVGLVRRAGLRIFLFAGGILSAFPLGYLSVIGFLLVVLSGLACFLMSRQDSSVDPNVSISVGADR